MVIEKYNEKSILNNLSNNSNLEEAKADTPN